MSFFVLGMVLVQLGEGSIDYPISFPNKKLLTTKKNYTMMEKEGLDMVYALHKFRHYMMGRNFKMYIDHSTLKYLVNKSMFGGNIC